MDPKPYPTNRRIKRDGRIKKWHVWFIIWILTLAALLFGAYRVMLSQSPPVDDPDAGVAVTSAPSSEPTPTPTPTPEETADPEPTPTPEPVAERTARVAIFNNTRVAKLAARRASEAREKGWNVVHVGNWRGSVPESTVYYSAGLEDEAALMAKDLGISRTAPKPSTVSLVGLTVVLRS